MMTERKIKYIDVSDMNYYEACVAVYGKEKADEMKRNDILIKVLIVVVCLLSFFVKLFGVLL